MIYFLLAVIGALCLLNSILLILVGMNIIQLREIIQSFMEGPPIDLSERDPQGEGLEEVETSQMPYSTEPLIEE
jgi:hypothetical protein